jgi:hypothetical protein
MSEWRTCLIHHVTECLGVIPTEATDRITFVLTRKDRLNQRRKLVRSKRALDQTLTGWSVGVDKKGICWEQLVLGGGLVKPGLRLGPEA